MEGKKVQNFQFALDIPWVKYIALAVIVAIVVVGLIILYRRLREYVIGKLIYKREFGEVGVYETEYVDLIETVINPTFIPVFFVDIEQYIYNQIPLEDYPVDPKKSMQYFASRFNLWPFMKIRRKHLVKCTKRGFYRLETVEIYANKKVRYIEAPAELYVYPRVVPLTELVRPSSTQQGESITTRRIIFDPFSLNGVRDYMFGDPFNSINFKATAKTGDIKVNKRDYCSNRILMAYLNFQIDTEKPIPTPIYEKMMERGLSYASALIREAAYTGYRAGFAANCNLINGETYIHFPIEHGTLHLVEILKEMAKVRPSVGVSFQSLLDADIQKAMCDVEVYIFTPFMSDDLEKQIIDFQAQGNYVHIIKLSEDDAK